MQRQAQPEHPVRAGARQRNRLRPGPGKGLIQVTRARPDRLLLTSRREETTGAARPEAGWGLEMKTAGGSEYPPLSMQTGPRSVTC